MKIYTYTFSGYNEKIYSLIFIFENEGISSENTFSNTGKSEFRKINKLLRSQETFLSVSHHKEININFQNELDSIGDLIGLHYFAETRHDIHGFWDGIVTWIKLVNSEKFKNAFVFVHSDFDDSNSPKYILSDYEVPVSSKENSEYSSKDLPLVIPYNFPTADFYERLFDDFSFYESFHYSWRKVTALNKEAYYYYIREFFLEEPEIFEFRFSDFGIQVKGQKLQSKYLPALPIAKDLLNSHYRDLLKLNRNGKPINQTRSEFWTLRLFIEVKRKLKDYERFYNNKIKNILIGIVDFYSYNENLGAERKAVNDFDKTLQEKSSKFYEHFGVIIILNDKESLSNKGNFLDHIEVYGNRFPVVYMFEEIELHSNLSNPINGLTTCAVITNNQRGLLTAKHVVEKDPKEGEEKKHVAKGNPVEMACGYQGKVIAVGPDGIDAVICSYEFNGDYSFPKNIVKPMKRVAPYLEVYFVDANSNTISTSIRSVYDTEGILDSPHLPSRIFLQNHGEPGDSGALIIDKATEQPLGIYTAGYRNKQTGETGGIAQHLYQAAIIMEFEIYGFETKKHEYKWKTTKRQKKCTLLMALRRIFLRVWNSIKENRVMKSVVNYLR